jgi:hypothetical protein
MANEYLKRTPTSTGNRKVFTWSGWVKRNYVYPGSGNFYQGIFGVGTVDGSEDTFIFSDNKIRLRCETGTDIETVEKFRDAGNWMHIMMVADSTKSTSTDRLVFYVNGARVVGGSVTQNLEFRFNSISAHYLGEFPRISAHLDGQMCDVFFVDGQALTPEVFGFYKDGNGYISAGSTQSTDFRNGQWVPRTPREIKNLINENGGFGVNGFYLPMNDSSNFGADFHCEPNSIIKLKGENLPQPRNGAPETTDAYVSQLREDPYAANLVLAVPGISTSTSANLVSNGTFDNGTSGWTVINNSATLSVDSQGRLQVNRTTTHLNAYQYITTEIGKRYTLSANLWSGTGGTAQLRAYQSDLTTQYRTIAGSTGDKKSLSFTALETTTSIIVSVDNNGGNAFFDNIVVKQEDAPRDYSADIKGSGTNKTLTANDNAGIGYEIPSYYGSAMTFDGSGDYLSQTYNADFNFGTDDFTVEMWVYPNTVSSIDGLFAVSGGSGGVPKMAFHLNSGTPSVHYNGLTGASDIYTTSGTSIPAGQWSHLAYTRKGTTWTWYINGVATGTGSNSTVITFTSQPYYIGYGGEGYFDSFDGKIQDLRVYKGVAKYTGGFDVPKPYTPVGIGTWRAVSDTCQNNFATWNPLDVYQNAGAGGPATLSGGNLITGSNDNKSTHSNFGVTSGKWYYESMFSEGINNSDGLGVVAQYEKGYNGTSDGGYYILYRDNGGLFIGNATSRYDPPAGTYRSWGPYDVISVGIDVDNREVIFFNKGVEELRYPFPSHVADGAVWMPTILNRQAGYTYTNFGQNPTFSGNTTAGTYTDSNGKGLFKYQPPSGFLALCEDNLPTPTIKDPGEYFKTVLYTGDGAVGRSITGVGFQPDLVWIKGRNASYYHELYDSIRKSGVLFSNVSDAESTINTLNSFDSDGFTISTQVGYNGTNGNGQPFVAWCWKAGGPAVTNTDGSIVSRVSANQDAGFSIVSWTGTGSASATVGHGLGKTPAFIISKKRSGGADWFIKHKSLSSQNNVLFTTGAQVNVTTAFSSGGLGDLTSSSTFGFLSGTVSANNVNENGATFIAYCWTEIEGFSKFGSYVGNASTDGPFVYCGFKPAFVLVKSSTVATNWYIFDNSRKSTNPITGVLFSNTSDIETFSAHDVDFVSNGFKVRQASGYGGNNSGETYIFAAFAESPFKYANSK